MKSWKCKKEGKRSLREGTDEGNTVDGLGELRVLQSCIVAGEVGPSAELCCLLGSAQREEQNNKDPIKPKTGFC